MDGRGEPFQVALPERVGRTARLGPFPSGRDALKFASYAAVGAVVAGATDPWVWLPFLGAGFAVAAVRIDGKGLDARVTDYVRWRVRVGRRSGGPGAPLRPGPRGGIGRALSGGYVAVLTTGGVPVAFLPSPDARELFQRFRELLRAHDGGLLFRVDTRPIDGNGLRPSPASLGTEGEGGAREGYRELVALLARHRRHRTVYVAVWVPAVGASAVARLEERVQALTGRLLALGLTPDRLRDARLGEALTAFGWGGNVP